MFSTHYTHKIQYQLNGTVWKKNYVVNYFIKNQTNGNKLNKKMNTHYSNDTSLFKNINAILQCENC